MWLDVAGRGYLKIDWMWVNLEIDAIRTGAYPFSSARVKVSCPTVGFS